MCNAKLYLITFWGYAQISFPKPHMSNIRNNTVRIINIVYYLLVMTAYSKQKSQNSLVFSISKLGVIIYKNT